MRRKDILQLLAGNMGEIRQRFDVDSLALFGSVARDEAGPDSDVDILVHYRRTPGMFGFLDLKLYLENLVHHPVDLVTERALKHPLRDRILREAVRVQ